MLDDAILTCAILLACIILHNFSLNLYISFKENL